MVAVDVWNTQDNRPTRSMTEHKIHEARHARVGIHPSEALSPPNEVLSPNGKPMTLDDLPRAGTQRWVIRRKAEVVAGVRGGLITLDEACRRYRLSVDEFRSWERLLEDHGLAGLRATRIRKYRKSAAAKKAPKRAPLAGSRTR